MTETQWNGEPCTARRVTVTVADSGFFPAYWAREFVGMRRKAVEVEYGGETFYLDDEDSSGWHKVTHGGSPWFSHSNLTVEPGSVEPREAGPCEQHPNAPVIGGMCGGCTQYPADLDEVRQHYTGPNAQPCTKHRGREERQRYGCNGPDPADAPKED